MVHSKQQAKTYEKKTDKPKNYDIWKEVQDQSIFKIQINLQNNILNYPKTIKTEITGISVKSSLPFYKTFLSYFVEGMKTQEYNG